MSVVMDIVHGVFRGDISMGLEVIGIEVALFMVWCTFVKRSMWRGV